MISEKFDQFKVFQLFFKMSLKKKKMSLVKRKQKVTRTLKILLKIVK